MKHATNHAARMYVETFLLGCFMFSVSLHAVGLSRTVAKKPSDLISSENCLADSHRRVALGFTMGINECPPDIFNAALACDIYVISEHWTPRLSTETISSRALNGFNR